MCILHERPLRSRPRAASVLWTGVGAPAFTPAEDFSPTGTSALPDRPAVPNNAPRMARPTARSSGTPWAQRTLSILGVLLLVPALTGDARAQRAPAPTASASAGAPAGLRIHVRGSAELQASASAEPEGFTLRGELVDDAGSPIPRATITVQAFTPDGPKAPIQLRSFKPCDAPALRRGARGANADDLTLETDDRGAFCALGAAPLPKVRLVLRYAGSKIHDPFETEVGVESEQEHLLRTLLRFEPPPEIVDLDHESVTVTGSLRVDRNEQARVGAQGLGLAARREGLTLSLEDEHGNAVAEAITGGDGRARFEVKTARLDPPGQGELNVRFAGTASLAKASASQPVVRRAEVHLALSHPIERADAEEGFPIDVEVSTGRGPVSGGVVEIVRMGPRNTSVLSGETIGAGAVDGGHARVTVTFASGGAGTVPILLRYVPAAPWYRAGPALQTDVHLAGPGILKQLLLALTVLVAAAWVLAGWRRAPKALVPQGETIVPGPPSGRAGVQVLGPAPSATGWRGVVSDAHEGTPVAGATLVIIAPSFAGDGVVARVITDERGAFALEAQHRSDARLVVDAPFHSTHEQALPPPSTLGVALVTRRRALLDRLVRWARRQGAPFDGSPEPTPGHVRRVAARGNAEEIEQWARQVEAAAYSPDPVGEELERGVRSVEPRPVR